MNNISVLYVFIIQEIERKFPRSLTIKIMAEPDAEAPSSTSVVVELVTEGN